MIPQIDLFHEMVYQSPEGFVAVRDYTDDHIQVNIYTPDGIWCGSSGASCHATVMADIRSIIKCRIKFEQNLLN